MEMLEIGVLTFQVMEINLHMERLIFLLIKQRSKIKNLSLKSKNSSKSKNLAKMLK